MGKLFFNAIQGFVVAIACCFIHQEVKLEIKILLSSFVIRMKCLGCCRCISHIDDDYIHSLRYSKSRNGHSASIGTIENQVFMNNNQDRLLRKSKASIVWSTGKSKYLSCLFDNKEPNDFFRENPRKSSSMYRGSFNSYMSRNFLKWNLFKSRNSSQDEQDFTENINTTVITDCHTLNTYTQKSSQRSSSIESELIEFNSKKKNKKVSIFLHDSEIED